MDTGYEILEHTADVRVRLTAPDLEGLLRAGAEAFYALTLEQKRDECVRQEQLEIQGVSREDLLVRWLQELVYRLDVRGLVVVQMQFEWQGERHARIVVSGYTSEPGNRAEEVKAATYHGLEVRDTGDGLEATVILDV